MYVYILPALSGVNNDLKIFLGGNLGSLDDELTSDISSKTKSTTSFSSIVLCIIARFSGIASRLLEIDGLLICALIGRPLFVVELGNNDDDDAEEDKSDDDGIANSTGTLELLNKCACVVGFNAGIFREMDDNDGDVGDDNESKAEIELLIKALLSASLAVPSNRSNSLIQYLINS